MKYLFVTVAFVLSLQAQAEADSRVAMERIRSTIEQWDIQCNTTILSRPADEVRDLVASILFEGFTSLATYNQPLVDVAMERIETLKMQGPENHSVKVICAQEGPTPALTERLTYSDKETGEIVDQRTRLYLGLPLLRLFSLEDSAEETSELEIAIDREVISIHVPLTMLLSVSAKQAIFHEFLHLLRMDNLSSEEHNHAAYSKTGPYAEMVQDVIYSCQRLAFDRLGFFKAPNYFPERQSMDEVSVSPHFLKQTWLKSCLTCSAAYAAPSGRIGVDRVRSVSFVDGCRDRYRQNMEMLRKTNTEQSTNH
jgi:hypothetical protein